MKNHLDVEFGMLEQNIEDPDKFEFEEHDDLREFFEDDATIDDPYVLF